MPCYIQWKQKSLYNSAKLLPALGVALHGLLQRTWITISQSHILVPHVFTISHSYSSLFTHFTFTHIHTTQFTHDHIHISHFHILHFSAVTHSPNHHKKDTYTSHTHRRHLGNIVTTLRLRRPGEQVSTLTS
ncbi:hypothetical protein Taro_028607, partial [Colocasia esculenta]|nr:hypothetical protein [Colocasia esculenta]